MKINLLCLYDVIWIKCNIISRLRACNINLENSCSSLNYGNEKRSYTNSEACNLLFVYYTISAQCFFFNVISI